MNDRKRQCAGMTLAEVVVALALFMLGMAGFFALSGQIRNVLEQTGDYADATRVAEEQIERMRILDVSALASGSATDGVYNVSWTVATNIGYTARNVRVQVTWDDRTGMGHQTTTRTILEP